MTPDIESLLIALDIFTIKAMRTKPAWLFPAAGTLFLTPVLGWGMISLRPGNISIKRMAKAAIVFQEGGIIRGEELLRDLVAQR